MNELSTTEARTNILNRRGKGIVALIPIEDLRYLEELEDQADLEEAKSALKRSKRGKSWKDIKKDIGL